MRVLVDFNASQLTRNNDPAYTFGIEQRVPCQEPLLFRTFRAFPKSSSSTRCPCIQQRLSWQSVSFPNPPGPNRGASHGKPFVISSMWGIKKAPVNFKHFSPHCVEQSSKKPRRRGLFRSAGRCMPVGHLSREPIYVDTPNVIVDAMQRMDPQKVANNSSLKISWNK